MDLKLLFLLELKSVHRHTAAGQVNVSHGAKPHQLLWRNLAREFRGKQAVFAPPVDGFGGDPGTYGGFFHAVVFACHRCILAFLLPIMGNHRQIKTRCLFDPLARLD